MSPGLNKSYQELRKEGTFIHYIWRWSKDQSAPNNLLSATPIKVFGLYIGWKVYVVKAGYEKYLFTNY